MKLRIAFVAPFGLGQKTTVWARTLPLARALVANGHAVTIIIPPWDTPTDSGIVWQEEEVQIVNVPLHGGIPLVVLSMLRAVIRFRPDIIHIVKPRAHAGLVQWVLWQVRHLLPQSLRVTRPRIFLDIDDWEQAWAPINHYHPLVARVLAWQEEWGIRHADAITAASHWLVDRAKQYTPQTPILYLPNGVTAPAMGMKPQPTATKQILFYSRYVEVCPDWLTNFWCALHYQEPTATLVVFGDALEAARPAQFQAAMQTHCPAAAAVVTWQPYDMTLIEQLYAESACAIFPSAKTPLHEAKCSVKLATTLLRGVPVVASAVGEQAYYGAEGAAELVAADATPTVFAATVVQILIDSQPRKLRQAHAQERLLRDYSPVKLGSDLEDFYHSIHGKFSRSQTPL